MPSMQHVHNEAAMRWMPVTEAGREAHLSVWTIYRKIQRGELRAIRPGHRWLVLREDVENMLKLAS